MRSPPRHFPLYIVVKINEYRVLLPVNAMRYNHRICRRDNQRIRRRDNHRISRRDNHIIEEAGEVIIK